MLMFWARNLMSNQCFGYVNDKMTKIQLSGVHKCNFVFDFNDPIDKCRSAQGPQN